MYVLVLYVTTDDDGEHDGERRRKRPANGRSETGDWQSVVHSRRSTGKYFSLLKGSFIHTSNITFG